MQRQASPFLKKECDCRDCQPEAGNTLPVFAFRQKGALFSPKRKNSLPNNGV